MIVKRSIYKSQQVSSDLHSVPVLWTPPDLWRFLMAPSMKNPTRQVWRYVWWFYPSSLSLGFSETHFLPHFSWERLCGRSLAVSTSPPRQSQTTGFYSHCSWHGWISWTSVSSIHKSCAMWRYSYRMPAGLYLSGLSLWWPLITISEYAVHQKFRHSAPHTLPGDWQSLGWCSLACCTTSLSGHWTSAHPIHIRRRSVRHCQNLSDSKSWWRI